jgi:ectoine hydroxylase-related dioxygenase (phytanoyl-CoA dioxygenase family)
VSYSAEEIAVLAEQIRINGYAVIEDGLPADRVEAMRARFDELMAFKTASEPFNRGNQRFQMYLPWEPPFADPLLYEDERVLAVMEAVMGPDLALQYFASDTPLPGSEHQRVHSDTRLLFPETQLSLPCYGMVLNVPLVDCTEENGSLEFWPGGTHFSPVRTDLDRLAAFLPSARANLKAGSFLLRDLRMWHRGTPNRSNRSRPHVALVYTRPWYRFEQQAPCLSRAAFEALSERAKKLLRYAIVAV